jgi:hypothetical protein
LGEGNFIRAVIFVHCLNDFDWSQEGGDQTPVLGMAAKHFIAVNNCLILTTKYTFTI